MSYCKEIGKDRIIFATKEDHEKPSTVELSDEKDDSPGLILPDGEINWNCPCLGGMAAGPCGYEFREAFSCFHYSQADPKGSDCLDKFTSMKDCMEKYPNLYPKHDEDDDEFDKELNEEDNKLLEEKLKEIDSKNDKSQDKDSNKLSVEK